MLNIHKNYFIKSQTLYLILFLFFISNLFILILQKNVWWDAAVYAGMGKYIFSFGSAGLWESSRPLVWPVILGLFWKLNLDVVFFGKLLSLLFSVGVLYFTYLIGEEIFDKKTAILSVLLLALTSTFFFFSTIMLSGIISTFFVLTGIYFFIRKNYFFSGLFFGLGFMTRFLQLMIFLTILLIFLVYNKKEHNYFRNFGKLIISFLIPVFSYLILNYYLYGNILHSFFLQALLTKLTGWMYFEPWWFYFVELFKENFLYVFALFGLFVLFKDELDIKKSAVVYPLLIFFLLFSFTQHKEMRFLIVLFPFLFLITSVGLVRFFEYINNRKIRIPLIYILIIFILQSFFVIYLNEKSEFGKENRFLVFQEFLGDSKEKVWVSNPVYAIFSDENIDELIYYPVFDQEKINFLNTNLKNVDAILLDTCDILCNPNDEVCSKAKNKLISNMKNQFKIDYVNIYEECEQFIFSSS